MNERIKELALQANLTEVIDDAYQERNDWQPFVKKFAELIVKDCVDLLREESERLYKLAAEEKDELFARNFEVCAEKCWDNEVMIKEHFGVEK